MVNTARSLWTDQGTARRAMADDALTLWAGTTAHSLSGSSPMSVLGMRDSASGYNGVQSIVDTKYNATIRNEVRPLFMTEGGDSELRERVEAMQEACDGQRYTLGLEGELGEQSCLNGFIFGAGGVEFWADLSNSRTMVTPAWHWEYFVSRQEARNGEPQQMFSRHVMPRDVLLSFLETAGNQILDAVHEAPSASWDDSKTYEMTEPGKIVDLVVIFKAWHLPSGRVDLDDPSSFGKGKDGRKVTPKHDGRHMVCLQTADGDGKRLAPLISRPWPYDHYPTAWFKPNRVPGEYWGRGEPEVLVAQQMESNQWNERVYQVLDRYARPGIILDKAAKLNPAQINNSPFNIWQVTGNPNNVMKTLNEPAVSADLINRLDRLPVNMRDQRGMSEMSMTARRPTGINHEPGMAYLAHTETIRHTAEFRAWTRYNLDCDKNIVRCLNELSEHDPDYEVVFEKDEKLIRQNWKKIYAGPSKYKIKAKGTNLFKQDPAQQSEQMTDLIEKQILPPDAYFDVVKSPDLEMWSKKRNVMKKAAEQLVRRVIKGPEFTDEMMPDPYMDLQTCKRVGLEEKAMLEVNEDKWEKVQRVVQFLEQVDALLAKMAPPPAPAPAGAPGIAAPPPGPAGMTAPPPVLQ
jgi:hypothetical protein